MCIYVKYAVFWFFGVLLYASETWTVIRATMEMWIWRRVEKISWADKISNEEILQRVNETRTTLKPVEKHKHVVGACVKTWITTAWYNRGKNEGGGYTMHLLSDLMKRKSVALEKTADVRKEWQKLKRAGSHTPASQQITWRRRRSCILNQSQ